MVEEEIARRYSEQEMRCPIHLSIGQEACAVGVASQLSHKDFMVSTHRSHAHYLAKGGNLKAMIAELYGKDTGCSRGHGGSMHLVDWSVGFAGSTSIVGGTIPIGVGLAFAAKIKDDKSVVAVMIGDAAVEEGVFHESANFASLHRLPVLFVCENNLYSCYTHIRHRQPFRPLSKIAEAHGLSYQTTDGTDVRKISAMTAQMISELRCGLGPFFFELPTYRLIEHCGPNQDDNLGYRDAKELAEWKQRDPVLSLDLGSSYSIKAEIDEAFDYARG